MCQLQDFFCHFDSKSDDDTANILLNCLQMVFFTVSHDDHVIFFDIFFHFIRVGSCYHDLSLNKITVSVTFDHLSSDSLGNSLILRPRTGKKITVGRIHVSFGNITDCDQTFQSTVFFSDWERNDAVFLHQIPCIFQ